ncbi:hypothetical protein SteCoe_19616 [Stentor coeruleus]|uniref:Uncharacterized protein n=1 Tax=Stentor coeruleus TaxID=5963 RepID=A0A1R2BUD5_9CILI|nr:hypothetical protein SteCoe_19616 [Stentor coeruleus]
MRIALAFIMLMGLVASCPAGEFYDGLIEGFESDPDVYGNCGNALMELGSQLGNLFVDIESILEGNAKGFTSLVTDYQKLTQELESTSAECDFTAFINALAQLATPQGQKAAFTNYMKNAAELSTLSANVVNCEADYNLCGKSVGSILRILSGASLQFSLRDPATKFEIFEFIRGIAVSYSGSVAYTPLCKGNSLRLIPPLDEMVKDLITNHHRVLNSILFSVEYTVVTTCWKTDWSADYNYEKIASFFKVAFDIKAAQLSYFMNTKAIDGYLHQIQNCTAETFNCGQAIPAILSLNSAWVGYH